MLVSLVVPLVLADQLDGRRVPDWRWLGRWVVVVEGAWCLSRRVSIVS
jgi:hypothetical protein